MGVTFVTAFFLPSGSTYKTVDRYFDLFDQLAGTGIPLIVYLDVRLSGRGKVLCARHPNIIRCIYDVFDQSLMVRDLVLPAVRNFDKDTRDYMCIQLTKLRLMAEVAATATAATAATAATGTLAWIDFGIYHMFRDIDACSRTLKLIAARDGVIDLILSPGYKNTVFYPFEHICWKHCGSLLVGRGAVFQRAYARQTELVRKYMPCLTWEVNYWAMMDEYFLIYIADHNDLILERLLEYMV
jgi:hypothetical protein